MRVKYAFQYADGKKTYTGIPNDRSGRMTIAGELKVFKTSKERSNWVNLGGNRRVSVNAKEVRKLFAGMSKKEFQAMVDNLVQSV